MKWVGWEIVIFSPLPCDDNCSAIYDVRAEPSLYPKKLMGERLNVYKEVLKGKFNLIDLSAKHNASARKLTLTIRSNGILEKNFAEKLRNYLIELAKQEPLTHYKNTNLARSLKQPEIPAKKPRGMSWNDMCQFLNIVPQPTAEVPEEIEISETPPDIENILGSNDYFGIETNTNTQKEAEAEEEIVYWSFENN